MKRIVALFLVAMFLVSVAGCTPKSAYDKLLAENGKVQKKYNDLSSTKVHLEKQLVSKEKELKSAKESLRQANAKVNTLEKELAKQTARIKKLES